MALHAGRARLAYHQSSRRRVRSSVKQDNYHDEVQAQTLRGVEVVFCKIQSRMRWGHAMRQTCVRRICYNQDASMKLSPHP